MAMRMDKHTNAVSVATGFSSVSVARYMLLLVLTALPFCLAPALAFAADPATLLCQAAYSAAGGRLGQGAATLGFCIVGVAACFGRASWTQGIVAAIGASTLALAIPLAASLVGSSC